MSRVLTALRNHALIHPEAIALTDGQTHYTYGALSTAVEAAALNLLLAAPLMRPEPVAAVRLPNGLAWVILDLALVRLGWTSLPLPDFFNDAQQSHALADAGADIVIEPASTGTQAIVVGGVELSLSTTALESRALPWGTAKVTYTSGSTGRPKGVCLSQDHMETVAGSLVQAIGARFAGRHIPVLPLSILLENVGGLYASLLAGGCYHVASAETLGLDNPFRPDPLRFLGGLSVLEPTSLILPPELLRVLMAAMAASGTRLPSLRLVAVGGAKVSLTLLQQAESLGLPVYEGYGLSECASVVALNTPLASRPGSVGRPLPHLNVRLEDGEVVVEGAAFLGYTGEPAHHGPFRTGDIGDIDADGFLHILGRRANTIITSFGRNIAPEWVESELLAQPEIAQAMVMGEASDALCAVLAPARAGLDAAAIETAVERANASLPSYARIGRWLVREPFDPLAGELTGNGRPRRSVLAARHRDFIEASSKGDLS